MEQEKEQTSDEAIRQKQACREPVKRGKSYVGETWEDSPPKKDSRRSSQFNSYMPTGVHAAKLAHKKKKLQLLLLSSELGLY